MDIERRHSIQLNNCRIYSEGSCIIEQNPLLLNCERVADSYASKQFVDDYDEMQRIESLASGTFDLLFNPLKDVNSMVSHTSFSDEILLGAPFPASSISCPIESSQTLKAAICDSESNQIMTQIASFDSSSMPRLFESSDWSQSFLPAIFDEDERVLVKHKTWQQGDALQNLKSLPCFISGLNNDDFPQCHATNTAIYTSVLESNKQHNYPFMEGSYSAETSKEFGTKPGFNCDLNATSNFLPSFIHQTSVLSYDPINVFSQLQQIPQPFASLHNQLEYTSPDYQRYQNSKQFIEDFSKPLRIYERNVSSFDCLIASITSSLTDMSNSPDAGGMSEYPRTPYSCIPSKKNSLLRESLQTNMYEEVQTADSTILGENRCKLSVTTPSNLKQEGSRKRCQSTFSAREDTKIKRRLQLEDVNSTTSLTSSSSRSCCNVTQPDSKGDRKLPISPKESIKHSLSTDCKPRARQGCANDPQSIAARNRRERISERLKILQDLVPNGTKVDLVTMLEKAINYVKFLQLQVKVLATDEYWPNHDSTNKITPPNSWQDKL